MDECVEGGWMGGWMGGWIGGWMGGWRGGWIKPRGMHPTSHQGRYVGSVTPVNAHQKHRAPSNYRQTRRATNSIQIKSGGQKATRLRTTKEHPSYQRTYGWMDGLVDVCIDGWFGGWIGGCMYGRRDGWMDEWWRLFDPVLAVMRPRDGVRIQLNHRHRR